MAAVLACGQGAVLSHQSAAVLWELLMPSGREGSVIVSTPRRLHHRRPGIRVHSGTALAPDETTYLKNLPLTTPMRTIFDLAGALDERALEQAMARADRRHLLDRDQLATLLTRHPGRRGNNRLRAQLSVLTAPTLTRSEAEERFLALIRKAELPEPRMNALIRGFEVDALWGRERLIVEIDGFAFHSSRTDFERDRHRDGVLAAAGYQVIRITWRRLTREPLALAARLAQTPRCQGLTIMSPPCRYRIACGDRRRDDPARCQCLLQPACAPSPSPPPSPHVAARPRIAIASMPTTPMIAQ
jgi:very-short-patch-repair endonuclease